ncbi:MAG TPA: hypothetical protein HPQ03_02635 [Deltaproteobacteria bacterium]|nr:hypothetical protein [Deltaproteobacteria bacterium]
MKAAETREPQDFVQRIFRLGKKIELAFDHDSKHPIVRSTIINECDYDNKNITIAQATPRILPSFREKNTKMTTMVASKKNETMRVGVICSIHRFLNDYQLSAGKTEPAVVVEYFLPISRSNIRGAYRIRPNTKYNVKGKIVINGRSLYSDQAFRIKDISGTGIGLPIIRVYNKSNPLLNLVKGKEVVIELTLENLIKDQIITIETNIQVIRNSRYSNRIDGFIGGRYVGVRPGDEERLFQFIHDAQSYEIRTGLKN